MRKIRTLNDLQDVIDSEYSWRLKEIADMKKAVRSTLGVAASTLIRAGIPLFYAHWEGFVKNTAEAYITFVSCQKLRYEQLASPFLAIGAKRHIHSLVESRKSRVNIAAADFFTNELSNRAQLSFTTMVNTESNLSSSIFENIILSIGFDPTPYESRFKLIDESLLKRRNCIAHGEYLDLDASSYRTLGDDVIALLRSFKADIERAASEGKYKRQPTKRDE